MGNWLDPTSRIAHFALYALLFAVRALGSYCSLRVVMRCRYLVWPKLHRQGSKIVPSHTMWRRYMKFLRTHWWSSRPSMRPLR